MLLLLLLLLLMLLLLVLPLRKTKTNALLPVTSSIHWHMPIRAYLAFGNRFNPSVNQRRWNHRRVAQTLKHSDAQRMT